MSNDKSVSSYPLTWPEGWARTRTRDRSRFKSKSISQCVSDVLHQLGQMGINDYNIIISTNLRLRIDGLPYSNQPQPQDPGVSVWWHKSPDNDRKVIAVDKYARVEENIYAIAMTLDAMRGIKRWGGGEILDRAFTGFVALPPPSTESWRDVLEYDGNNVFIAKDFYLVARSKAHPDKGGSTEKFQAVEQAWTECQKELIA